MSVVKIKAVQQAISMMNSVSGTIKATVQAVNMAWGDEAAPLPVNEYHRRAHLIADLEIVLAKLIAEAHNEALEMNAVADEQHASAEMWKQKDIDTEEMLEAVHVEALEMNAEHDKGRALACRDAVFFGGLDYVGRRTIIEAAHAEALEMDAQRDIDNMVEEGGAIQAQIDFYALPFDSQRAALVRASYREALQINDRVSVELSRFKAAATGIMKSTFTADAKRQMVMAACSGLLVGIKQRLGIQLNPHTLSGLWGDHREQSI